MASPPRTGAGAGSLCEEHLHNWISDPWSQSWGHRELVPAGCQTGAPAWGGGRQALHGSLVPKGPEAPPLRDMGKERLLPLLGMSLTARPHPPATPRVWPLSCHVQWPLLCGVTLGVRLTQLSSAQPFISRGQLVAEEGLVGAPEAWHERSGTHVPGAWGPGGLGLCEKGGQLKSRPSRSVSRAGTGRGQPRGDVPHGN